MAVYVATFIFVIIGYILFLIVTDLLTPIITNLIYDEVDPLMPNLEVLHLADSGINTDRLLFSNLDIT